MFFDHVVFAGVAVVALMFVFFGGVGYFIWKDALDHK